MSQDPGDPADFTRTARPTSPARPAGAGPVISVAALAEALAGPVPPVLLDVRWRLAGYQARSGLTPVQKTRVPGGTARSGATSATRFASGAGTPRTRTCDGKPATRRGGKFTTASTSLPARSAGW